MHSPPTSFDPNPYASPEAAADEGPAPLTVVEVKAKLRAPAIGLLASAVWGMAVALFLGATVAIEKLDRLPRFTPQDQSEVATYACMLVAFLLIAATIARGALAMLNLSDLFAARNAALLAVFPCGGAWVVGLPFGVWAFLVLRDPRVQQEFRRRRAQRLFGRLGQAVGNAPPTSAPPPG